MQKYVLVGDLSESLCLDAFASRLYRNDARAETLFGMPGAHVNARLNFQIPSRRDCVICASNCVLVFPIDVPTPKLPLPL